MAYPQATGPAPETPALNLQDHFDFTSFGEASEKESGTRWRVVAFPALSPDAVPQEAPPPPPDFFPPDRGPHPAARRKRAIKARTIALGRLPEGLPENDPQIFNDGARERPHTRSECAGGPRPCPWVSCRYHLYLDVSPRSGSLKLNFPDLEVWELEESCALDVADRGQAGSEEIGSLLNLTRERARQLEEEALRRARSKIS